MLPISRTPRPLRSNAARNALLLAAAFGGAWATARAQVSSANCAQAPTPADEGLFRAIDAEDIPAAKDALADGAAFNVCDARGQTPLTAAAAQGNAALFTVILDAGAPIDGQDRLKRTALVQAVFDNQVDVARVLLARKADLNLQDTTGRSAVFYALTNGRQMLPMLLDAHPDLQITDTQGNTVLSTAIMYGDYDTSQVLRSAGAKFASPVDELYAAAASGDIAALRAALAAHADANDKPRYGMTPLMVAAHRGNTAAARLLLSAGADPNVLDSNKQSALFWAITSSHLSTVQVLLDAGVDAHTPINGHRTPLAFAVFYFDDPALIQRLIADGADVNNLDMFHVTATLPAPGMAVMWKCCSPPAPTLRCETNRGAPRPILRPARRITARSRKG
jgi:ankyrin repeat protein